MVLLTLGKIVTNWLGPPLLRVGVNLRSVVLRVTSQQQQQQLEPQRPEEKTPHGQQQPLPIHDHDIDQNKIHDDSTAGTSQTSRTVSNVKHSHRRPGASASASLSENENTPMLDMMLLIPTAQKLVSLAVYDESSDAVTKYYRQQQQEQQQRQSKMTSMDATVESLSMGFKKQRNKRQQATSTTTTTTTSSSDATDWPTKVSELRLQVLSGKIRPALIPNDVWSDVWQYWKFYPHMIKWIRQEFLISKYGPYIKEAMDAYPQLRTSPQLSGSSSPSLFNNRSTFSQLMSMTVIGGENDNDDNHSKNDSNNDHRKRRERSSKTMLPSSETVLKAFGMRRWTTQKHSHRLQEAMIPIVQRLREQTNDNENDSDGIVNGQTTMKTVHDTSSSSALSSMDAMTLSSMIPMDADLKDLSLEEILEIAGGQVMHCGPFNALCEEANIYQMWTTEYIQHLGNYLLDRSVDDESQETSTTIIDIGAGDGLLMHFLKEYMEQEYHKRYNANIHTTAATASTVTIKSLGRNHLKSSKNKQHNKSNDNNSNRSKNISSKQIQQQESTANTMMKNIKNGTKQPKFPTMIATDDGSWGIFAKSNVERMSMHQSLRRYAVSDQHTSNGEKKDDDSNETKTRVIVLCSWMPMGQDWTKYFRQSNVDEYILIGEADDGTCGHNWETWGNTHFYDPDLHDITKLEDDDDEYDDDDSTTTKNNSTTSMSNDIQRDGDVIIKPPYQIDGYRRWDMDVLVPFQFSRFDSSISRSSKTVSFRKETRSMIKRER